MQGKTQILSSLDDLSVNFVSPSGQESRFVRRSDDYFIAYLSSHNGCNKSCRFCHLTQSGQTQFEPSSEADMLQQARQVLEHYRREVAEKRQPPAQRMHFNWMARGEPLASPVIRLGWRSLSESLAALAGEYGLHDLRFNISSIFPAAECADGTLYLLDGPHRPVIFYSLYSMDADFRRRWIPKSLPPEEVLGELTRWQRATGGEVVLHWALIDAGNDSEEQARTIAQTVERHGLVARFNLVRYNAYSPEQGREADPDLIQLHFRQIQGAMRSPGSRIVPRVGFDVKASCGMFVEPSEA